jgi:hypothetical protein
MTLTNFPNGITSFGVPIYGTGGFPHSSGGNHYFTDSVNGSDDNSGTSWDTAKASIFGTNGGYALLTADQHDVLHVIGGATAYIETAVGTWAKDYTHCVAETNPIMSGGRARIYSTVATATAGEFVISATGCHFSGLHFQWGASATATSLVGVTITGDRNSFTNCNFEGPINNAMSAIAATRMLTLSSVQDNWFYNCKFGQRTIIASAATGAVVEFIGTNNTDNGFVDCIFTMYNSNTASAAVSFLELAMPDSGITTFKGCLFQNHHDSATADVIRNTTAAHGVVHLDYCSLVSKNTAVWATNLKTNIWTTGATGHLGGGVAIVVT